MWFFIAIQMASDVSLAILLTAESSLWTVSIKHGLLKTGVEILL